MIDQAEIHRMAQSKDPEERREAVEQLGGNFADFHDRNQAWDDLHRLTQDGDSGVRWRATDVLGSVFPRTPDKKQAWDDLHRLTQDSNTYMREFAAYSIGSAFEHIPQREQAWDDLILLTQDGDSYVKWGAAEAIGLAFPHVTDRKQAWNDLHYMTQDGDSYIRRLAAYSISTIFQHIPDRKQAWDDLHRLTLDSNSYVRWRVVKAIGSIFQHIPDRKQAWDDLHGMTQDGNSYVREGVAKTIGSVFLYISAREQAWNDLHRLTQDSERDVRLYAYHSSGRASIFEASEAETQEEFSTLLKKAIEFFEKASKEATYHNPAQFCLPFYRSFHVITFKKEEVEEQVQQYLAEAKRAVAGSESKEKLLEAVENLANALTETQKAREMDLEGRKCELIAYRRYCDRATELLETTEEKAPGATKLIKRGLPIIDERIKGIIGEIQEKSSALCKQTKGTPLENLGKEVNRHGQALLQIRDPMGLEKGISYMQSTLSAICTKMPEEERGETCELLKKANEELYIEDKVYLINIILGKVSSQLSFQTILEDLKSEIKARFDRIEKNIDGISQSNEVTRNLLIGYANKTQGILLKLLDESKNCESETQKLMKEFSDEMIKKLEEKDERWLEKLRYELIKREPEIEKELSLTPEIKNKWHKWIDYIKNKAEKETKEIIQKLPTEAVVLVSTEKILEYGVPFLSAAMSSYVALPALIAILYAIRGVVPKDR